MTLINLAITALLAALLLAALIPVLRARVPAQTRVSTVGAQAPLSTADIPKLIWTYWPQRELPAFLHACVDNWRRHAPDHEVRALDRSALDQWLPGLRSDFDSLPPDQQLDWLRVQLLARHGGVWMDTPMLLSRDLAWLHETRQRRAADYVGFYLERDTTRAELPAVQPWLMASAPGGRFVTALGTALDSALADAAAVTLPQLAAALMAREPQLARLVLLRAEDGPLAWQAAVDWRPRRLFARLALVPAPRMLPAVLRLNPDELAVVERYWRRRLVSPFSALVELVERSR